MIDAVKIIIFIVSIPICTITLLHLICFNLESVLGDQGFGELELELGTTNFPNLSWKTDKPYSNDSELKTSDFITVKYFDVDKIIRKRSKRYQGLSQVFSSPFSAYCTNAIAEASEMAANIGLSKINIPFGCLPYWVLRNPNDGSHCGCQVDGFIFKQFKRATIPLTTSTSTTSSQTTTNSTELSTTTRASISTTTTKPTSTSTSKKTILLNSADTDDEWPLDARNNKKFNKKQNGLHNGDVERKRTISRISFKLSKSNFGLQLQDNQNHNPNYNWNRNYQLHPRSTDNDNHNVNGSMESASHFCSTSSCRIPWSMPSGITSQTHACSCLFEGGLGSTEWNSLLPNPVCKCKTICNAPQQLSFGSIVSTLSNLKSAERSYLCAFNVMVTRPEGMDQLVSCQCFMKAAAYYVRTSIPYFHCDCYNNKE